MKRKILIYGYGNPGRRDDGLGIAFAEEIDFWTKQAKPESVVTETNYQLNIEDAELISHYDTVIFADASLETIDSFAFTAIHPSPATLEFTMHAVAPAYVVHLCRELFHKNPNAYLMHIKGHEWGVGEGLSEQAMENLDLALDYIKDGLANNCVDFLSNKKNNIFDSVN